MEEAVKVDDQVADGTCVWLSEHPKYRQWLTQSGATPLWIKGKPGSGKTTLKTYLVHEFQ
jgi:adenylylsulfate kinase-like enzyme